MTEQKAFDKIDAAISSFVTKGGLSKNIKVSDKAHSDWLVFNTRQLSWTENDVDYIIQIFPTFDKAENISGWNIYAAACFDQDNKRYYINKTFMENTTINLIAEKASSLFIDCYNYLSNINKQEIPFARSLK